MSAALANLDLKEFYENTLLPTLEWITQFAQRVSSGGSDASRSPSPNLSEESSRPLPHPSLINEPVATSLTAAPSSNLETPPDLESDGMPHGINGTRSDTALSRGEVARLEERCRQLERRLWETQELLKARDLEIQKLRRNSTDVSRHNHGRRHSHDSVGSLSRHTAPSDASTSFRPHTRQSSSSSSITTASNSSGRSYSEEDRARLRSMETFLTKTDRWSGAQVIQAVRDLNSEILQFAASAVESLEFDVAEHSAKPPCHDTAARVGPRLVQVLSSRDHSEDSILLQLGLQGCISIFAARAMSLFCIGFDSASNALLSRIYCGMTMTGKYALHRGV